MTVIYAVQPFAFAIAWLVSLFASSGVPLWALWRPLVVVVLGTTAAFLVSIAIVRRLSMASLLASVVVLGLTALWVLSLPIAATLLWWRAVNRFRAARGTPPIDRAFISQFSGNLGFASVALLSVVLVSAAVQGRIWVPPYRESRPPMEVPDRHLPNIYLLMLDGYPRADTLADKFGIDNRPFVSELEQLGFDVAELSRSNYSMTWATLASMFQMRYLEDLDTGGGSELDLPGQYQALGNLINDSPAVSRLRMAGYEVISQASPYPNVALTNADRVLAYPGLTRFEVSALEGSILIGLLGDLARDWIAEDHRAGVRAALNRVVEIASGNARQPVFVFDHVFSPHPPFVFEEDGDLRSLPDCYPSCSVHAPGAEELGMTDLQYRSALAHQVAYLNGLTLATVRQLATLDPDAWIVLFSDHGTRHQVLDDPREATRNFFAARVPGNPALFGESPTTVNLMAKMTNYILSADFPEQPFKAWISVNNRPLDLIPLN